MRGFWLISGLLGVSSGTGANPSEEEKEAFRQFAHMHGDAPAALLSVASGKIRSDYKLPAESQNWSPDLKEHVNQLKLSGASRKYIENFVQTYLRKDKNQ